MVDYEVNTQNFWVAANAMITRTFDTGIEIKNILTELPLTDHPEILAEYTTLVPPGLGGTNTTATARDLLNAVELCYQICDDAMVDSALEHSDDGVMIVGKNKKHCQVLFDLIQGRLAGAGAADTQIKILDSPIHLTHEAIERGDVPNYKILIVPLRLSEGYTLTALSRMIWSVYPSNNATREQIRGRINRIGQRAAIVTYQTFTTGLLTNILMNHFAASNLTTALARLSKKV